MISSESVFDFLDFSKDYMDTNMKTMRIDEFFNEYSYNGVVELSESDTPSIKVKDYTGWTDLFRIEKCEIKDKWYLITLPFSNIIVNSSQLFPAISDESFKGKNLYLGPNGNREYRHENIGPMELDGKWVYNYDGEHYKLKQATVNPYFDMGVGYNIITRSGKMTVNNIIICSSDNSTN